MAKPRRILLDHEDEILDVLCRLPYPWADALTEYVHDRLRGGDGQADIGPVNARKHSARVCMRIRYGVEAELRERSGLTQDELIVRLEQNDVASLPTLRREVPIYLAELAEKANPVFHGNRGYASSMFSTAATT